MQLLHEIHSVLSKLFLKHGNIQILTFIGDRIGSLISGRALASYSQDPTRGALLAVKKSSALTLTYGTAMGLYFLSRKSNSPIAKIKRTLYKNSAFLLKTILQKFILQEEYENASFHIYIRTEKEIRSPLEDETSAVYKSGLRLISVETKVTSSPFTKLLGKCSLLIIDFMVNHDY